MLIIFSHANSFPAGTYSVLFRHLRALGYEVSAIDKLGHDPQYPVTSNWPHLAQQVASFAQHQVALLGQPAFLVGHSLGGLLSLMAAAQQPELCQGVVLLDSPLIGGWRAKAVELAKWSGLIKRASPGVVSQRRRQEWDSAEAALKHFQGKSAFARWELQVLRDFVELGTYEHAGQRRLSFDRAIETAIYNTLPHHLDRLLRTHALKCPVAFIGGTESAEMRQVGMAMTRKLVQGRLSLMPGTHLFPMEFPLATAQAIDKAISKFPGKA